MLYAIMLVRLSVKILVFALVLGSPALSYSQDTGSAQPMMRSTTVRDERGQVQVSINMTNYSKTPPNPNKALDQWAENGHTAWKIPLLDAALGKLPFSAKPSTPANRSAGVPALAPAALRFETSVAS